MVEISIICLIYKSRPLAKAVYDSLYEHTPMLRSGQADLLFVANDPTVELVEFLKLNKYPFIINVNDYLSEDELFKLGYGAPEYMRRVYQGYNQGILKSKGQKIVLINSDNFFSEDWLENLTKYSDYKKVVSSTLVEPGHEEFGVFPGAIEKNFGRTVNDYDDTGFQKYSSIIRKTGYSSGGAYMPCLIYRDIAILAGLYPEGNIAGKKFDEIIRYGDESFYDKLSEFGVEHITSKDSVVYHLKEGEKSENINCNMYVANDKDKTFGLGTALKVEPVDIVPYIKPEADHYDVMFGLGKKFTAIITDFKDEKDLARQVKQLSRQKMINMEIVIFCSKERQNRDFAKEARYVIVEESRMDVALSQLFHSMYGEYLIVVRKGYRYAGDIVGQVCNMGVVYGMVGAKKEESLSNNLVVGYIIPKRLLLEDTVLFLGLILNFENNVLGRHPLVTIRNGVDATEAKEGQIEIISLVSEPLNDDGDLLVIDSREVDQLNNIIKQQSLLIEDMRVAADDIMGRNQQLIDYSDSLKASSSWRLMRPLRLVGSVASSLNSDGAVATVKRAARKIYKRIYKG